MIYYMMPSFLYCLYNNLSFKNLARFDPTTYLLLLQTRILMTGVIYQVIWFNIWSAGYLVWKYYQKRFVNYFMYLKLDVSFQFLFGRKLSRKQWISLLILTIGYIIDGSAWSYSEDKDGYQIKHYSIPPSSPSHKSQYSSIKYFSMLKYTIDGTGALWIFAQVTSNYNNTWRIYYWIINVTVTN